MDPLAILKILHENERIIFLEESEALEPVIKELLGIVDKSKEKKNEAHN